MDTIVKQNDIDRISLFIATRIASYSRLDRRSYTDPDGDVAAAYLGYTFAGSSQPVNCKPRFPGKF